MRILSLSWILLLHCLTAIAQPVMVGTTSASRISQDRSLIERLARHGELLEAFFPENTTSSQSRISSWNGVNGNDAIQQTASTQPFLRLVGDKPIVWIRSSSQSLEFAQNPFSSVTDGTLFVVYRPNLTSPTNIQPHILLGDANNTGYSWITLQSSSSGDDLAFGDPSYHLNGIEQIWPTRQDVYNSINANAVESNALQVVTAKGVSLSTWGAFNINNYRGNLSTFVGEIASIVLYENELSDEDRSAVEQLLMEYAQGFQFTAYTESFTTIVEDTDEGGNLANTGLDYDPIRDEILVNEYQHTRGGRILIYDRSSLSLKTAIDISAYQHTIQGLTYDSENEVYYVLGVDAIGSNELKGYDRNGNVVVEKDWSTLGALATTNSSLDLFEGHFFYFPSTAGNVNNNIYKIDPNTLQIIDSIATNPQVTTMSIEGLHVSSEGYWLGEGPSLRKYSWDGVIMEDLLGSASEPEGLTVDNDGNVYINRDLFFHGETPGGNRLYKYSLETP